MRDNLFIYVVPKASAAFIDGTANESRLRRRQKNGEKNPRVFSREHGEKTLSAFFSTLRRHETSPLFEDKSVDDGDVLVQHRFVWR